MSKGKFPNRDWRQTPEAAVEFVFHTHFWGNRSNSGKGEKGSYKRNKKTANAA